MNATLKMSITAMAVAAVAMAKKDVRYYLNGLQVETIEGGGLVLVGTDGHGLVIARDPAGAWSGREDASKPAALILPGDFVAALLKAAKGDVDVEIEVTPAGDLTYRGAGVTLHATVIDGRYPQWRQCMPAGAEPGPVGAFDARVLAMAVDAAAAIQKRTRAPHCGVQLVGYGPERAASFTLEWSGGTAGGVLMPLRDRAADLDALAALVAL